MIYGRYTFGVINHPAPEIYSSNGDQSLKFYHVEAAGFSGGYCLHDRLPVSHNDIYYHNREDDILVLFSGGIYNRKEVADYSRIDAGDPDPVIAAGLFLTEGPSFVARLNGDFAIFICRPAARKAYLFRDHIGIRPLAWSFRDENLIFSTDILDLCRYVAAGSPPEHNYLTGYFRYINYTQAPDNRVNKVLPGHYIEYSGQGMSITKYWDPEKIVTDRKMNYDTMLSELGQLLDDSVAIRCDGRFTAGAHVSGGLDSGMVALLARKVYSAQKAFHGYSWSPAGLSAEKLPYDERDMVRSLCTMSGIIPVFSTITPGEFIENLDRLYYNGGFFIEESLARQASENGTNLIFSGWGGDEFISHGDRGIETDLLRRLKFRTYFKRNPVKPLKRFLRYFLEYTVYPALGILQPSVARVFAKDARYMKRAYAKSEKEALRNFYFHTSRRQLHTRYLKFYHLQGRCETWTAMGYRLGIEYRYPLLDRRIIEYMLKVPSELLCRTGYFRPLLRIIGKGILPEDVRLNNSKKDHLFAAWWDELVRISALSLIDKAGDWKENQDLSFIDFNLLQSDIERYRNDPSSLDVKTLFKALVYINAVSGFSITYRSRKKACIGNPFTTKDTKEEGVRREG
jgi:asparagine synthase (glutamine-hydrolysing)